jgi:O-antigen ligase
MIRDRPLLGTGPGNWQFYYPYYHQSCPGTRKTFNFRRRALRAHNDYLQLTAEYGIFAGLLFVFIWLRQLYLILRWRTGKRGAADPLRFALGLSWLAFSLVMLVSFPLQRPYTRFLFFTLLALGEALAGNRPTAEPAIAAPEETPA